MAGKRVIGATVKLDGEKEFKSAVTTINKEIKTMGSSMTLLKEQTAGQANTLETLRKKHDILDSTLTKYREKQEKISEGLKHSESEYGRVQKEVADYKKQLDAAEKSLDEMRKSGTATTEEIEKQDEAVKKMRQEHEKNLEVEARAKQSTEDWKNKLNTAEAQVLKASKALAENDRYMSEAEQSSDKCAVSIDAFGKKTNETSQRLDDMNNVVSNFVGNEKFTEYLNKASEAMQKLCSEAYSAAKELDEGYDTIISATGATGKELEKLQGVADDVFGEMPVEMADVGEAVGMVNTRFKQTGDELKDTSELFLKFAQINNTDVSNSVKNADHIMKIFKVDSKDTSDMLGMFTSIGQKTGMTMDSLMGTLDKNGVTFQELGLSLEDSAQILAEFESNGVDTSTVLASLKKEIQNAAKQGRSASGMLSETSEAIVNAKTETEALQIATKAFGAKGALVMVQGLRDGRISLGNTSDAMKKYGDVVTKTFEATLSPWDEAKVAMNNLKTAGADLAGTALQELQPAFEKITGKIKDVKRWLDNQSDSTKKNVSAIGGLVAVAGIVGPKMVAFGSDLKLIAMAQDIAAGGAGAHSAALGTQTMAAEGASVAMGTLNAVMSALPAALAVTAVSGLVAYLAIMAENAYTGGEQVHSLSDELLDAQYASEQARGSLEQASESLAKTFDGAKSSIEDALASAELGQRLTDELMSLNSQTQRTAEEQTRMESIVSQLNTLYPELEISIDKTTGSLNKSNDEIKQYVANAKKMTMVKAYQEAYSEVMEEVVDATKEQIKAEMERDDLIKEHMEIQGEYNAVLQAKNESLEAGNGLMIEHNGELVNANDLLGELKDSESGAADEINKANEAIEENKNKVNESLDYAQKLSEKCDELGGSVSGVADATDGATASTNNLTEAQRAQAEDAVLAAQKTAAQLEEAAKKQQEAHEKLVESTRNSVHSQISLFEELKVNSEVSLESMNAALTSQQEVLTNYSANIEAALQYAMNTGSENCEAFVRSIASMGEDGAAYMAQFVEAINRNDGSAEQILSNFAAAEEAKNKYADQMVAMEEKTNESAEGMVSAVAGAEGNMANAAGQTAEAGVQAVEDKAGDANSAGNTMGENIATGMESASGSVSSAASSLTSAAKSEFASNSAYSWGQDMGYQFGDGIASAYDYVASAASDVADAAAAYLHHSTPDKGPLAGDDRWGEELGDQFAEGMQATRKAVGSAAQRLALEAADGLNHDVAAKAIQFEGTMSAMPISGMKAGSGESGKDIVVENRFYLGERDITDIITKKVINKITSIQHSKQLSKGGFGYV